MPSRAARPCRVASCHHLVMDARPCPVHGRVKPWQGAHNRDRATEARLRRAVVGYWGAPGQWVQGEEVVCWRCRQPALSPDDELGHIVPLARGGQTTRENVAREHRACNQRAGCELGAQRVKEKSARG